MLETSIRLEGLTEPGITLAEVEYPAGTNLRDPILDRDIPVYQGEVTLQSTLLTHEQTGKGTYQGQIILQFQACDDRACQAPRTVELPFQFEIGE